MQISIDELIRRAREAQQEIEYWPQEKVGLNGGCGRFGKLINLKNAQKIAKLAVDETRMGIV